MKRKKGDPNYRDWQVARWAFKGHLTAAIHGINQKLNSPFIIDDEKIELGCARCHLMNILDEWEHGQKESKDKIRERHTYLSCIRRKEK